MRLEFHSANYIPKEFKGNGYAFRGDDSIKIIFPLSEKGSPLKGRNFLPKRANSVLLKKTIFRKVLVYRNGNKKHKSCPPCHIG